MTSHRPLADLDWPEDAGQENGAYSCICADCGRMFVGHKRRVTCRACATRPKTPLADLLARLRAAADSRSTRRIDEELYKEAADALEECARDFQKYAQEHGESCGEDGSEECTCGLTAARKRWST